MYIKLESLSTDLAKVFDERGHVGVSVYIMLLVVLAEEKSHKLKLTPKIVKHIEMLLDLPAENYRLRPILKEYAKLEIYDKAELSKGYLCSTRITENLIVL